MTRPMLLGVVLSLASFATASPEDVTYWEHVYPVVKERCLGCHSGDRPKGRLDMETLEKLLKGGKKGAPVVAGKPQESLLYLVLTGDRKPAMPPPKKEEPLGADEIGVIAAWIRGGAKAGRAIVEHVPYSEPLEPPVYARPPVVTALLYSADGKQLFVNGYREILVHAADGPRIESASLQARLVGEAERVLNFALSPDGKYLAAVGGSPARFGEVQIWRLSESGGDGGGRLERHVRIGKDTLFALAFSPDGARLAVGGTDRSIHVLEVPGGKELYSSEVHSDWIFGLAFTSDGSRITSAGRDKTVKVSQAEDGKFLQTMKTFAQPVLRLVGRPGTALCLAGGEESTPILFDSKSMKEVRKLENQPGAILATAFSADGKLAAIGGTTGEIRVYQADDGARKALLKGDGEWVYALAFRPGSTQLAAAGYDGTVRIFDLGEQKEIVRFVPVPIGKVRRF